MPKVVSNNTMYTHTTEAGHAMPACTSAKAASGGRACWYWATLLSNIMHPSST